MSVVRENLKSRFSQGDTVKGTRSSHYFIPQSTSIISHKFTSKDENFADSFDFKNYTPIVNIDELKQATYVSCVYNTFWWVGMVSQVDENEGDVKIELLHPHGPKKSFHWPTPSDACYVPLKNVLCNITLPTTSTGWTYNISDDDYQKILSAFEHHN